LGDARFVAVVDAGSFVRVGLRCWTCWRPPC